MTQIVAQCPTCNGVGTVPHVRRVLADGEIPNPNDLDQYQVIDTCWPCNGRGRRLVDIEITETPKEKPYYGC